MMFEAVVLFVFVMVLFGSIFAIVVARKNLAEDIRIKKLLRDTPVTTIADAPASGRILIRGKVTAADGGRVSAPFTGADALWARGALQNGMGGVNREWFETVEVLQVDDESGRVARVPVRGANMRFEMQSVNFNANASLIKPYLASHGVAPNADLGFPYEAVLAPNTFVNVLGWVAEADDTYRTSADVLTLSPEHGELIVFSPSTESGEAAKHKRYIGCATRAIVVSAVICIVMLILLLR
jgi:hypothetical protein